MVVAHAGHWTVSLLYVAPVVLVVIMITVQGRRERAQVLSEDDGTSDEG